MPTVVAEEEVDTNASTTPSNIVVVVKDTSIVIGEESVMTRSTDLAITGHDQACTEVNGYPVVTLNLRALAKR